MNYILIIALISAVLLGGFLAMMLQKKSDFILKLFFSFSGAYLFGVTITHLIPDIFKSQLPHLGAFILLGFMFQILLESFTQGVEHGHVHVHDHEHLGLPYTVFIGLGLHAFMEGFPLSHSEIFTHAHTWQWGIILHKIPESIALTTVLICNHQSMKKPWLFLIIFSLLTPLGMVLGDNIDINLYKNSILYLIAFVAGSFIHISFTIIQESGNLKHHFTWYRFLAILLGVLLALFI